MRALTATSKLMEESNNRTLAILEVCHFCHIIYQDMTYDFVVLFYDRKVKKGFLGCQHAFLKRILGDDYPCYLFK